MSERIPCRVSADLAKYLRETEAAQERAFDPWDDSLMADICGKWLQLPIQSLLFTLIQIRRAEQSFGLEKEKAFDALRPSLESLEDACKAAFNDL